MRIEHDLLGEVSLPKEALYGAQTARAAQNFTLRCRRVNLLWMHYIVWIKYAASQANCRIGKLTKEKALWIEQSCCAILQGEFNDSFILPAIQGGAGTSMNMNVNELIANVALKQLGHPLGSYQYLHPLNDVNMSQSTNDVVPTALKMALIHELEALVVELMEFQMALQRKEDEFSKIKKLGRTQLKDAVETTLGASFGAFSDAISRDRWRLYKAQERLKAVNLGGTAIGTGVGTTPEYQFYVLESLQQLTRIPVARSENLIDATQNLDAFVEVSGLLKTLAVNLSKISNDLRLLDSGPHGGIGEIFLPPLQPGSSIMPTKINPVGPEFIKQIYFKVVSNDMLVTMAAAEGELELNAFIPVLGEALLENVQLLCDGVKFFTTKVIDGIHANEEQCAKHLKNSEIKVTKYISQLGYEKLCELMQEALKEKQAIEPWIERYLQEEKSAKDTQC